MSFKLAVISPNDQLSSLFREYCRGKRVNARIIKGDSRVSLALAESLWLEGFDVLISRGGTAKVIRLARPDIPVIEVTITAFDLLRALKTIPVEVSRVVIAGHWQFTYDIEENKELFNRDIDTVTLKTSNDTDLNYAKQRLKELFNQGCQWMIGDTILCDVARSLGYQTTLVESGKQAVMQAIADAENLAEIRRYEIERSERFRLITKFATEGMISIDSDRVIDLFNPSAKRILGYDEKKIVGKKLDQALPEFSRFLTDSPENLLHMIIKVGSVTIVANIIPIVINDQIVRYVITFQGTENVQMLESKIRRNLAEKGLIAVYQFKDIVGVNSNMMAVKADASEYALVNSPVLIYGETGTGKELFAQAIHNASKRVREPFVAFNCAALASNLIESELFGYVDGAFTGARKGGKAGLFEQAHNGTVFLDEIGEIDLDLQVRLLRVLEEKQIRRIGDDKVTPVDVRVVVATNKNLKRLVEEKKFRQDLYYRINVLNLNVPSLRERRDDIPIITKSLLGKINLRLGKSIQGFTPEGYRILKLYNWPGNVRQLENMIERMIILSKESLIGDDFVKTTLAKDLITSDILDETDNNKFHDNSEKNISEVFVSSHNLKTNENHVIRDILISVNGNKSKAAEILGISRTTLWRKMKTMGIVE